MKPENHLKLYITTALSAIFGLYYLLSLYGYGNDCDTYLMIRTGQEALLNFEYSPSRPPGYLVPELIIGFTSLVGKFYLSNLISALLGTLSLFLFWKFLRNHFDQTNAALITLIVGLNPYYVIAASSSMDYIYSIFFCISAVHLLIRRKHLLAALCMALCVSCRLSNILIVSAIYVFFTLSCFRESGWRDTLRLIASAFTSALFAAALYLPSFIAYDYSFGFLTFAIMDWSFLELLYRFIYKNICLLGLLPLLFIGASTVYLSFSKGLNSKIPFLALGISIVVLQEALFLKVPAEISYLLPLLFIIVPFWVLLIRWRRSLVLTLLILTSLSNVTKLDFLDIKYNPNSTNAIGADIGLFMKRGPLVTDLSERKESHAFFFNEYGMSGRADSVASTYHVGGT